MMEFEQHAINLAQYSILLNLPSVNIHLPSKKFLQTLYHRWECDATLYVHVWFLIATMSEHNLRTSLS